jgi:hypothetical protein
MLSIDLGTSRRAAVPVAPLSNDSRIKTGQKERKKEEQKNSNLYMHSSNTYTFGGKP